VYVLDTNILIDAHRRYYSFDIAPCFWRVLLELAKQGSVVSIDRVKQELIHNNDLLSDWAVTHFDPWFKSTDDEEVLGAYRDIMNWSFEQDQYNNYAKVELAETADSWLVAYASANDCIVATHEVYSRNAKNVIPIPNICKQFGVQFKNTFEMLRDLRASLGE